jgi:hypothetical protein
LRAWETSDRTSTGLKAEQVLSSHYLASLNGQGNSTNWQWVELTRVSYRYLFPELEFTLKGAIQVIPTEETDFDLFKTG